MTTITTSHQRFRRLPATLLVKWAGAIVALAVAALFAIAHAPVPTEKTRIAELEARLSHLRNAADLYYHDHGRRYPGEYSPGDGSTRFRQGQEKQAAEAFMHQLTLYTDRTGRTSPHRTAQFRLGPYLRSSALPDNPLMSGAASRDIEIDFTLTRPFVVYPADGRTGWRYYLRTGWLAPNDNAPLRSGVKVDYQ